MSGEILAGWFGASIASAVVAAVVARVTAVNTLETKTAVLTEREDNHYKELNAKIDMVLDEVRAIRK